MKRFLKILAGIAIVVGLAIGAVLFITSGERDIARDFILNVTSGSYEAAQSGLHQQLVSEFPIEKMQEAFGNSQPYTEVSFSSVEASGGQTTLKGTATTQDGCASQVDFVLVSDQITSFNITPLCFMP